MSARTIHRNRRRLCVGLATVVSVVMFAFGAVGSASAADGNSIAATATNQIGGTCDEYYGCPAPGEWCAEFAKWVWAQNGIDVADLTSFAASFYTYGVNHGTLSSTPQVGDAVVFDYSNGYADHVAIVTKVNAAAHTIVSVGGNENGGDGVVAQDGPYDSTVGSSSGMGMAISGYIAPVGLTAAVPGQLVAIGDDGGIYHEIRNPDGTWTGFAPLTDSSGGVMKASDVSIAGDPDGSSQVVAIGGDGLVYHEERQASGNWTGFQAIAGAGTPHMAAKAVAITADPDGSAQIVAIGADGNVYHEVRTHAGAWTGFQPVAGLGGSPTMAAKAVSIAADPDGSAQLVVIGSDGFVYHEERQASGNWTGFAPVAGVGTSKMAATAVSITGDPDGSAQLVAIGDDGNVYHEVRTYSGSWTGFAPVAGVGTPKMAATAVSITGDPDGSAQLVAVGDDGNVYHEVRTLSGSWTGFAPVAGVGTPKMAASVVSISSVPGAA